MRIALLGTGKLATELGRHVLGAGHGLTVWNRTASRTRPLVEAGATDAATPAEAVDGVDAVVTVLFGPQSVRDTVINPDLLRAGDQWLDVTTVGPEDAEFHHSWALNKGVRHVAGPVVGSLAPARAGELGCLLGGEPADVASVRELVRLWSDENKIRTVPRARDAAAGKLIANLALGVAMQGVSEALTYAGDVDLDRDTALAILGASVMGGVVRAKRRHLEDQEFGTAEFTAAALAKDLDLVLDASLGLHAVQAARDALDTVIDDGRGDEDFAALTDV